MRQSVLAICAVALLAGTAAEAQERFTLRFNHVLGPSEPYHQGFLTWAERVRERTNGGLRIDVFHSAQLGVEEDIIEQIRQGANVGQNTDSARMGNYVPGIAVMNGPYAVQTLEEVAKLTESATVKGWVDALANDHGIKVVCFDWVQGYRNFFTNKPVRIPADLSGLRIRTPPAPIWQESIRALGAAPVAMAFGDMYPALQQRAIDGVELVYNNIPAGRLYEVLNHAIETKHIMLINFQVISTAFFNRLPVDYQNALVEECRRAGQETSRTILDRADAIKQDLIGRGMTIIEDVDMAAFRAAGAKAFEVLNIEDAKRQIDQELGR